MPMEPVSESTGFKVPEVLYSPTLIFAIILVIVYIILGITAGSLIDPIQSVPIIFLLMQCDTPVPVFPWTLITTIFLHANIIHLLGNVFFLILFGFILEEQVSKTRWVMTFFITGLAGSVSFVAFDFLGYALASPIPGAGYVDCAVGASGAVYGIMGAAVGLRVVIILILLLGLDIFAGGGTPAHLGGLVAGLVLRNYWSLAGRGFRGI